MSVDLWIDSVAAHAKVILVRILGGYDWWRYGCDQLAAIARAKGIKLALLPGECRDEDLRLIECSTLPRDELDALLGYFREGGPENMTALVRRLAALAGHETQAAEAVEVPKAGFTIRSRRASPITPLWRHRGDPHAPRHPHPLLPFDAARLGRRADRRAVRGAARKGHAPRADLRREPEGSRLRRFRRSSPRAN